MTGHLVLSTLHTNDAPSAVVRLRDLGLPTWLITGALTQVVAQRLVRRICPNCVVDHTPTEAEVTQLRLAPIDVESMAFKTGAGCQMCGHTGYRGRLGLFEQLSIDTRVRELLLSGASTAEVRRAARRGGMRSLREEGLNRVADGLTSLEELLRVIPPDAAEDDEGMCPICANLLQPDFALCPWCGAPQGPPTCAKCGRGLELGWRLCPDCGCSATDDHHVGNGVPTPVAG